VRLLSKALIRILGKSISNIALRGNAILAMRLDEIKSVYREQHLKSSQKAIDF